MKKIRNLKLPSCPFCGVKIWYLEAFIFKNRPIYKCKNCKEKSAVMINPGLFKTLLAVEILAFLIFGFALFFGGNITVFGLILVLILFTIFYGFSPYSVRLGYPRKKNPKREAIIQKCNEVGIYRERKQDSGNDIYSN